MEQITRGASQRETTTTARAEAVRVGVDLAKRVIQVHGVDANGRVGLCVSRIVLSGMGQDSRLWILHLQGDKCRCCLSIRVGNVSKSSVKGDDRFRAIRRLQSAIWSLRATSESVREDQ